MPSAAATTTAERMKDVERLVEIHADLGGAGVGRRVGVEVLNRSAIVLLTAIWEGYVEELAAETLAHLVTHLVDPAHLPKDLRKKIADELKADPNHLAVWTLSADGWRSVLVARLASYKIEVSRGLNTPKSSNVEELFESRVGISGLSSSWNRSGMTDAHARRKLDDMVVLRGDIAHGSGAARAVRKGDVTGYKNHVSRLVKKTDERVRLRPRGNGQATLLARSRRGSKAPRADGGSTVTEAAAVIGVSRPTLYRHLGTASA